MEGRPSQLQNAVPGDANHASAVNQAFQSPIVLPAASFRSSQSSPVEASRTSQSVNMVPVEASRTSQSQSPNAFPGEDASRGSRLLNMASVEANSASRTLHTTPVEPSRSSKSLNMMPVELARTSQLLLVPAEPSDDDVQTIKEVLSVHHVPVVASLHWEKLHTMLHTLCDRIAIQALRLERAEEQGKTFLGFKDELEQLWSCGHARETSTFILSKKIVVKIDVAVRTVAKCCTDWARDLYLHT